MECKYFWRKVWLCARSEYLLWLRNPRMILLAVLFVYIHSVVIQPMFNYANEIRQEIGVLEPFIAACNNETIMLLFPVLFVVLMADFPRTGADTTFRVFRAGRRSWLAGQVIMLMLTAATVVGVVFAMCVFISVLQGATFTLEWSGAVTFATNHVIQQGNMVSLLPPNIYFQLTLISSALSCCALLFCSCVAFGMIMLAAALYNIQKAGLTVIFGAIAIGAVLLRGQASAQWLFPPSHFVLKQHFTAYFSQPNMPLGGSLLYFSFASLLGYVLARRRIHSYHFISGQGDGI